MKRDALRAAIAALANRPPAKITVEGIGEICVRKLSLGEVEAQAKDSKSDDQHKIARSLARVLVDEDGVPLYDANDKDDVALLAKAPFETMSKVLDEANRAAGLDDAEGTATEKN